MDEGLNRKTPKGTGTDLTTQTKDFAIRVIRLVSSLPKSAPAQTMGKQLLRSGTSVGMHYRDSIRVRSDAEFIEKMELAVRELENSLYWMELLVESEMVPHPRLHDLMTEAGRLVAVFNACVKNVRSRG